MRYSRSMCIDHCHSREGSFYINTILGTLWVALCLVFATDDPHKHPRITNAELTHIEENRALQSQVMSVARNYLFCEAATSMVRTRAKNY
jgi:hypothetical protein